MSFRGALGEKDGNNLRSYVNVRLLTLLAILVLSFTIRSLTANFIRSNLSDTAWFQSRTYGYFDDKAQSILDGKSSLFWIDDPSQTQTAVYPPGYALLIAGVYKVTGFRSAESVQVVQWVIDSWAVLLIVAIGAITFGWRVGVLSGSIAALSPLLALYGATPLADAPTSWIVLAAVLLLILAAQRQSIALALAAGALLGFSCWFRSNALILGLFWAVALLILPLAWRKRLAVTGAMIVGLLLLVTPLAIRNAYAFNIFSPAGLGLGTNLWEGIGETGRAAEFGAVYGDDAVTEQERVERGLGKDTPFSLYYPDGVVRDRERARKAFAVIRSHPLWYAGVMGRRMISVLIFIGNRVPYVGSNGINVTSQGSLPPNLQRGVLSLVVNVVGKAQNVLRIVLLPLMIIGIVVDLRRNWRTSLLILSTVIYYLVVGSALHTEIRYGLPMQALLLVFAGLALSELIERFNRLVRPAKIK